MLNLFTKAKPIVRWGQKVADPIQTESRITECDFVKVIGECSAFLFWLNG
jgi:hypothetical protein